MKNLIYIETYNRNGSGIIFPCEYKEKNAYIIFTNFHVVKELSKVTKTDRFRNLKNLVDLEIFDENEKRIHKSLIKEIQLAHGFAFENRNDVAALLVILDDIVKLDLNSNISLDSYSSNKVFTTGYPEVLRDDSLNRRLILEGNTQLSFPKIKDMGYYKINDAFHFYDDISDKDLFDGLSGGPVYRKTNGSIEIIGMNQSISNVGDGKNPFNIVYFITINQVLNILRLEGIIIFVIEDNELKMKWIHDFESVDTDNKKNVLLLGSSGAGKSSFVKELMYHGDIVNASGDGQTTRMDVYYELSNYTKKPSIRIDFYNKAHFGLHLSELMRLNHIQYAFAVILGFEKFDLTKNIFVYLHYIYDPLNSLLNILHNSDRVKDDVKKEDQKTVLSDMSYIMSKFEKAEKDEIIAIYEEIIDLLLDLENECFDNNDIIKRVFDSNEFEEYLEEEYATKQISGNIKNNEKRFVYIKGIIDGYDSIGPDSNKRFDRLNINSDEDITYLYETLNTTKGYFDIKEFDYISKEISSEIRHLVNQNKKILDFKYDKNYRKLYKDLQNESMSIEKYYEEMHSVIWERFNDKYNLKGYNYQLTFTETSLEKRTFISQGLKVVNGNSYSGLVEKVFIKDIFSNNYAYLYSNKEINTLTLIDTCGLDHIDRGGGIYRHLAQKFLDYKDKKIGINIDAILYLKKLDSGKPTEIESILPVIFEITPGTPLYCVFTGGDIYYMGRESILINYKWEKKLFDNKNAVGDYVIPKSASYLYENKSIVDNLKCSKEWKEIIHQVIVRNMMPFVSDSKLKENNIYVDSNRYYINRLIDSMLIDEWNSGFIDFSDEIKKADKEIIYGLKQDIKKMFYHASIFSWNYRHHMTINANVTRLLGEGTDNTLGFNGAYIDRWDMLLKSGYTKVFLSNKSKVIDIISGKGIERNHVESMFAKLIDQIIKWDMVYVESSKNKSEFRQNFEDLYIAKNNCNEPIYNYNVFDNNGIKLTTQYEKKEFLKDVCNFRKGLENKDILERFCRVFLKKIKVFIEEENGLRVKRLLKYNSKFKRDVNNVFNEINMFTNKNNDDLTRKVLEEIFNEKMIDNRMDTL